MPEGEKPYRLYKGGRVKGKVPKPPPQERTGRRGRNGDDRRAYGMSGRRRRRPSARRIAKWTALALGAIVLFVVVWGVAGFLVFEGGVSSAGKRIPRGAKTLLADQSGLLLSHSSTILLLGTDHSRNAARAGSNRSDSIMLVRTDPDHHRITYLSIPRDLWVNIPGHGEGRINAAYQLGGASLALRTIRAFTGLQINHLAVVDFNRFSDLIGSVGGITVDNPSAIVSNRFDCPYKTQERCQQWPGWRFPKGKIHLDERRALIYARVRENRLDAADSDITRGERQQQVMQAVGDKLASVGTFFRLPFVGDDLLKPLATDLSAWELLQLGWVKFRAGKTLRCRLGGVPEFRSGQAVIVPSEENRNVILMFRGDSAPQPPPPGSGPFGPGCPNAA